MMDCATCHGAGTQRVPVRRAMELIEAYYADDTPIALEVDTVPCPECQGMGSPAARDRVGVVAADYSTALSFREAEGLAMEIATRNAARVIAEKLLELGAIKVTSEVNEIELRRDTRASVTVVLPVLGRYTFADQLADAEVAAERRGMERAARIARAAASRFAEMDHYGHVQALAIRGVAEEISRAVCNTPEPNIATPLQRPDKETR